MSFVSFVVSAPKALDAQMTGAPAAGYKREPGTPSATLPAALREIGFDQHMGQRLPEGLHFKDEEGRDAQQRQPAGS